MFCKECGTENLSTQIECIQCKTIINTYLPLNAMEKIMLIGSFIGLLATMFFGIIPILISLASFYIIKKYKNIKFLNNLKNILLGYVIILGTTLSIFCFYKSKSLSELSKLYYKWHLEGRNEYVDLVETAIRCNNQSELLIYTGIIGVPLGAYIIYFLTNISFNILRKHEKWIINYGLFINYKNEKSILDKIDERMQEVRKEPLKNVDELLKWAELKEKGLITEEEFQKAKEKILKSEFL